MIDASAACQWWRKALALLDAAVAALLTPDSMMYNSLILACDAGRQWQTAVQLLKDESYRRDIYTCTAAMSACEKAAAWAASLSLFCDARAHCLLPNMLMYSAAISAIGKGMLWAETLHMLCDAQNSNVRTNSVMYASTISACEKGNRWSWAIQLLSEYQASGLPADVITYSAAISACEKGHQWLLALDLLRTMVEVKLTIGTIAYTAAIGACENGSSWEYAVFLWTEMLSDLADPNATTYSYILSACGKGGHWESALEIFQAMTALMPAGVVPCTAAVSACRSGLKWQEAIALLGQTPEANQLTFDAAANSCEGAGEFRSLQFLRNQAFENLGMLQRIDGIAVSPSVPEVLMLKWAEAVQLDGGEQRSVFGHAIRGRRTWQLHDPSVIALGMLGASFARHALEGCTF